METISWQDFEQVDLRVGTIVTAEVFAEARRPAYILHVDFGPDIGVLKSSAQITDLYQPEGLVGQQVIGVVNFPPKQIGPIQSQCLITGFPQADGAVVLIQPERPVEKWFKAGVNLMRGPVTRRPLKRHGARHTAPPAALPPR